MDYINMIGKAEALARARHSGQVDKAGKDYFEAHIRKVADIAERLYGTGSAVVIALLHDLLEDTPTTSDELRREFPDEIVDAVIALTRRKGEEYMDYIVRVKRNRLAASVKVCDLIQNMDLSRIPNPDDKDRRRAEKYAKALVELMR